jgi:hypothetical protein
MITLNKRIKELGYKITVKKRLTTNNNYRYFLYYSNKDYFFTDNFKPLDLKEFINTNTKTIEGILNRLNN